MHRTPWLPQFGWQTSRRAGASSSSPPNVANLAVWLDGSDTDGSNNSTRTNGVAFNDWLNKGSLGGTFSNATATSRPLFASSLLNGRAGATFDGTDDVLISSLAASAFTFLSDGTGCAVYAVVRTSTSAVQTIAATRTAAGTSRGLMVGTNTLARPQVILNDGAANTATVTGASSSLPSGQFSVFATRLALAATPDLRVNVNGGSVGTIDATAFSALAPAATLQLGANAVPGAFFNGDIVCLLAYNVDHDDTQRAAVESFLASKYGVTFPV